MTEVWIGNEKADYSGDIECQYSISDVRDFEGGNLNTSYDIDLPHTETNKRLLKYINELSSAEEQNALSRIIVNDIEIIRGQLLVLSTNTNYTKCVISADNWINSYDDIMLSDLDLSAYDEVYNSTNVVASWSAAASAFFRYPLVHFGLLDYKSSTWYASDFSPWFNVKKIIEKIFSGYTISSTFFNTDYFKSLYISALWSKADSESAEKSEFDVQVKYITDNDDIETIASGATVTLLLSGYIYFIKNNSNVYETFVNDTYTAELTGTHRFQLSLQLGKELNLMTENSAEYVFNLYKKPLVGADVVLQTISRPVATIGDVETIDTGYIHLIAGEKIKVGIQAEMEVYNPDVSSHQAKLYVTTASWIKSIADNRCLLPGLGLTIQPELYMPKMTQAQFIGEIKKHYNLRFWLDSWNKTIYIEPQPTFNTSTVKDITNIDYTEIETELISSNYFNIIYLQYANDSNDVSLTDYNTANILEKGQKKITLASEYCEKGEEHIEVKFSTFMTGKPLSPVITPVIPRIWGEYDKILYKEPQQRPSTFNVKIGEWKGLNDAGLNDWDYESSTKTTWPEIAPIDFSTIYATYFAKTFHYIDKGKIVTLEGEADKLFIQELNTVLNSSSNEGFRPIFKFYYQNEYHYGLLNNYKTNGDRAIYELILII